MVYLGFFFKSKKAGTNISNKNWTKLHTRFGFKPRQSLGKQNTFTQVGYLAPDWLVLLPLIVPPPTNFVEIGPEVLGNHAH